MFNLYLNSLCFLIILPSVILAATVTDKVITAWSTTNGTGYNGYVSQVKAIYYTKMYSFVSTNSIPFYSIGPWNANDAVPNNATHKFTRSPTQNTGTKTSVGLGACGLWIDGVKIYNAKNADSYNSLGYWNENAHYWEKDNFDDCYGHPDGNGCYHNHVNPICFYDSTDSTKHSPLLGFVFDGYPIYGPFGYSSANDSTSAIRRILPGYSARSITERHSYYDGTVLSSDYWGPDVNATYPIGAYIEDYEWSSSTGDLDEYNGRWCVTPEFPSGTYAYFVATDSNGNPTYPYTIGPSYWGTFITKANVSVPSSATQYF